MTGRDLRLVPVAGGAWVTALVCVFLIEVAWWWTGIAMGLGIVAIGMQLRRPRGDVRNVPRRGPGWGLLAVVFFVSAATAMAASFAAPQRSDASDLGGGVSELIAEISSSAAVGSDGRMWFDAQTLSIGRSGQPHALSAPVRIGVDPLSGSGLELGARIHVVGEAMPTDPGERAALVVFGTKAEIVEPAKGVFGIAARVRHDFVQRALRLPQPGSGLLPGLAVGDTRAVSETLNAAMLTSGLSHLTAVSGANCALVVAAVFWLVSLCGGGRAWRVVLSLTALAGFVVLVTPEPSVIRAAVMAGLVMLTLLLGRPTAGIGVLCLAATAILIADPWLAATPGFALSAAATAALIVLAPPLARGLSRIMPAPLALAIAIPLSAQLACGPIIAVFSEQQSLIGVAANLLAAPAAPIATVLGLLACLAAPVPGLADLLAVTAWLPAAWIATTATTTAALPGAQLLIVPGIGMALLVALLSAAVGAVLFIGRTGRPPALVLRSAAAVLVVTVALGGARLVLDGPLAVVTVPGDWKIAACDVGQGDALLVRSAGEVALIDTGPEPAALEECLRSLGIDRIDLLVLTHFDLDHVGGVEAVIGRVATVLHGPTGERGDEAMLDRLEESGATLVNAAAGQRGSLGAADWRVLWPRPHSAAFPAGNDASVVVAISGGGVPSALFLGDLSAVPQRLLAGSAQLGGPYAVVKVAHHGSADQDAGLYMLLHPAVAIFSVGADNDYGHPRQETLALLGGAGARVLRTDQQGRILLGVREGELAVWSERPAVDSPIDVPDPG